MKISKNSNGFGTTYYKITENQLLKYFDKSKNQIVRFLVSNNGFDAFNLDLLYGSRIVDDVLYLCVTDGREIEINGNEADPESAIDDYGISGIQKYIKNVTDDIMGRYLTDYELTTDYDLNELAFDIISGKYADFTQVVKDAEELDILD